MNKLKMTLISSFALWLLFFGLLVYNIFSSSKTKERPLAKINLAPESVLQFRLGVSKDLWLTTDKERFHIHLTAPFSNIRSIPKEDKPSQFEIVETLHPIQMELFTYDLELDTLTRVQKITAEVATYQYQNQKLFAKDALLSIYDEEEMTKPTLEGHAEEITLSLQDKSPTLDAKEFSFHVSQGSIE